MILHPTVHLSCIAFAAILLVSCEQDDDGAPADPSPGIGRYSLLAPGNYWIYEVAHREPDGTETQVNASLDSVYVAGDSIINGNTYAVLRRAASGSTLSLLESLQRDSADCIVSEQGLVLFRITSADQVIQHQTNTIVSWEIDWIALGAPVTVTVPFGTFSTREVRSSVTATGSYPPPAHEAESFRALDHGLVKNINAYASGSTMERRLVREHIQ